MKAFVGIIGFTYIVNICTGQLSELQNMKPAAAAASSSRAEICNFNFKQRLSRYNITTCDTIAYNNGHAKVALDCARYTERKYWALKSREKEEGKKMKQTKPHNNKTLCRLSSECAGKITRAVGDMRPILFEFNTMVKVSEENSEENIISIQKRTW